MKPLCSPVLAQVESGLSRYLEGMPGPQFLGFYAVWFLVVFGGLLLLRWRGLNTPVLAIIGLAVYEVPGLLRMFVFSEAYMHRWIFLVVMMVLGGLAFLARIEPGPGGNSSSGGCGTGGGCGGGGCGGGGGGCGGCGGS